MRIETVVTKLIKENLEFKEYIGALEEGLNRIKSKLFNIGAPLNDNILKYNKKQLKIFFEISQIIKEVYWEKEVK